MMGEGFYEQAVKQSAGIGLGGDGIESRRVQAALVIRQLRGQLICKRQQRLAMVAVSVAVTAVMRAGDFGAPGTEPGRQRGFPNSRLARDP
jgi:hypothetical protein